MNAGGVAAGVLLVLAGGCAFRMDKAGAPETSPAEGEGVDELAVVCGKVFPSFSRVKKTVIGPRCLSCHDSHSELPLGRWADARAKLDGIREAVFVDQSMPQDGALQPKQLALLKAWLDGGGRKEAWVKECNSTAVPDPEPDPAPNPGPPPPTTTPSYPEIREKFLVPYCLACHGNGRAAGKLALDTLDQLRAKAIPVRQRAVAQKNMPPKKHANQPTDDERATFADWIQRGMP